jgi:hypothetical protein
MLAGRPCPGRKRKAARRESDLDEAAQGASGGEHFGCASTELEGIAKGAASKDRAEIQRTQTEVGRVRAKRMDEFEHLRIVCRFAEAPPGFGKL